MTMPPSPSAPPIPVPLGLLAELTHRCPLACPYCSNPLALEAREDELDTATWLRVFREAAALGVLQVHLSGGEPGARRDLVDITAGAHAAGLYTNLITSAVGITDKTLGALAEAGLDHVQISIQDSDAASADCIAGYAGAFARKLLIILPYKVVMARQGKTVFGDPPPTKTCPACPSDDLNPAATRCKHCGADIGPAAAPLRR